MLDLNTLSLILGDKVAFFIYGLLLGSFLTFLILRKLNFLKAKGDHTTCIGHSSLKTPITLYTNFYDVSSVKCEFLYNKNKCSKFKSFCIYLRPNDLLHSNILHLKKRNK